MATVQPGRSFTGGGGGGGRRGHVGNKGLCLEGRGSLGCRTHGLWPKARVCGKPVPRVFSKHRFIVVIAGILTWPTGIISMLAKTP